MDNEVSNTEGSKLLKQIDAVKLQLQAQIALTSQLQARWIATVDAMETLRLTHEREVSKEKRANQQLSIKLDRLTEYTEVVETERDELRDAVLALVERTEGLGSDPSWQYPRIHLTHTLEPLQRPSRTGTGIPNVGENDYAPLIITTLKAELEKERASHAQTHDRAELEILYLQSQLAKHQLELQEFLAYGECKAVSKQFDSPWLGIKSHTPKTMTPEESFRVRDSTSKRNQELQSDVRKLAKRVEQTQTRSRPSTPQFRKDIPNEYRASSPWKATSPAQRTGTPDQRSPPSPHLEPYPRQDSPSPYTMTPRNPGTPRRRPVAQLHSDILLTEGHPQQSTGLTLVEFQEDIQRLASEIDALKKERREWRDKLETDSEAVLAHRRVDPTAMPMGESSSSRDHEELAALRMEFEAFKQETVTRESALREEIAAFREKVEGQRALASEEDTETLVVLGSSVKPTFFTAPTAEPLLEKPTEDPDRGMHIPLFLPRQEGSSDVQEDDCGSEQSMELATPLQPIVTFHDGDMITMMSDHFNIHSETSVYVGIVSFQPEEAGVDPASIPLPTTPILSPTPSSPPPLAVDRATIIRDRPPTPFTHFSSQEAEQSSNVVCTEEVHDHKSQGVEERLSTEGACANRRSGL